jgi:hypothetical protein
MYRHMTRRLHGQLGKGNRRPLPKCFTQGLRELFPSDDYVGFKPSPFESGPRVEITIATVMTALPTPS